MAQVIPNIFSVRRPSRSQPVDELRGAQEAVIRNGRVAFMNEALKCLNEIFPDVEVDVLREMLTSFSEESRIQLVADALLRKDCKEAQGRRKRARLRKLETWEMFRGEDYKAAVKATLKSEFKGLQSSSINAVLAENNFDYARSRTTLLEIAAKSWRFSISSWFRGRRKDPTPIPQPRTTGCPELDQEIMHLTSPLRESQIAEDDKIARLLDEAEHAAASDLVECETCFGEFSWNQIGACASGHFVCYDCLRRGIEEGLYGQGSNLSYETCSVRCLSATAGDCDAHIMRGILKRALPSDTLKALDEKATNESLERSGLRSVRCPFCSYAEADDVVDFRVKTDIHTLFKLALLSSLFSLFFIFPLIFLLLSHLAYFLLLFLPIRVFRPSLLSPQYYSLEPLRPHLTASLRRVRQRRYGHVFQCRSETCGRQSCQICNKEYAPWHECFSSDLDSARIFIERAMADAVKRTCPECHISFIKSDGCNKLTCPCGYVMCYICRADIRKEKYQHFCQHFRLIPGAPCTECEKCDLYAQEDETSAIKDAAQKAEEQYFREHAKPVTWDKERGKIGPGVGMGRKKPARTMRQLLEDVVDAVVDDLVAV